MAYYIFLFDLCEWTLKRWMRDHTCTYIVSCPCEHSAEVSSSKVLEEDTPDGPNTQERNNSGGPEVTQLFSYLTLLTTKFQLLIKTEIPKSREVSSFKSLRCVFYHADKCYNDNNYWHFNIYEQDKFCAQLS